ncbi:SDR family NAD(P)-dependent oxidoreductase [Hymenobacter busanensis]|uniref:SDR family NAD(P)-dependent oxidoreductase n=1 Tax=Hymenobacter busanensis TaxID=2607656 RepID=A0A7L4ZX76_9BACT|nr:SDR family NAD(P)-dependent oxidoreductase [Hymenobacter busanensis]KAA9339418.1 SDR family NAD(P)-dependent oxidoreductase [Hymenobacter busanensis]QHJ06822.1 SDR family NAD(P)-dependent oxidoreductase [Hymenobacter busanensis]
MDLNGKVAIVTGVSKGIGLATAQLLLAQGAVVAGWGRHAPEGLTHERFQFFACDVRDEVSVTEALTNTQRELGQEIHVLVNNAGLGISGAIDGFSSEDWHRMFDTNVHGLFYCTRAVLPQMKRQQLGHIINISSIAGLTGIEMMAGYCATKYAVRGFSHSLFKEVRSDGIKVTCIYPGSTQTNFFDDIPGTTANPSMMQPEDIGSAILYAIQTPFNFHIVDVEMRPLQPKRG